MCVLYIYIYIRVCVYVCVSEVHGIRIHIMNDFLPTHLASSDALGPAVQVPYSERLFQALAATTRRTHSETKQKKKRQAKGQTNAAGVVRVRTIHAPCVSKMPTSTFLGCPTQPSTEVIPQRCSGSNSATTFGYQASHTVEAKSKTATPIILATRLP